MRSRVSTRLLCVILTGSLLAGPFANAQQDNGSSVNTGTATTQPTAQSTGSTFTGPLSDYVPCIFSEDDQFAMRAQAAEKRLDRRAAEQLFENAKTDLEIALAKYSQNSDFITAFQAYLDTKLQPEDLIDRTVPQAISHIRAVLYQATVTAATKVKAPLHTDDDIEKAKQSIADQLMARVRKEVASVKLTAPAAEPQAKQQQVEAGSKAISDAAAGLKLNDSFRDQVINLYNQASTRLLQDYSRFSFSLSQEDIAQNARKAVMDAKGYPLIETADPNTIVAAFIDKTDLSGLTQQAATKSQAKQFEPPNDVSCSMAVMSWKETRDIFGRRVANTFIAIQVTLRNLNTKNEFLVHDIQVAVDTGITQDYFGRFQAGRDKLLVRAVAQRGQSDDRRNVVLNTLQTVGAIAAASSLVGGTIQFKDAVAVFQGAFLTGFTNIFPDHTVEQLNHINDLVFSASNTSKVVVPVQGSVPLVTFISEKPIEQLPFAWCGRLPHKGINPELLFGWGADRNCNFNGGTHDPGYVTPYRYTRHGKMQPVKNAGPNGAPANAAPPVATPSPSTSSPGTPSSIAKQKDTNDKGEEGDDYPQGPSVKPAKDDEGNVEAIENGLPPWDDLKFEDWRGAAVRMLQEHTFVVVGGVHIQEVVTQPKIANLSCPQLTSSKVDLSQTDSGKVSCTVSGSGLSLVTAVNLQKDSGKISGTFKPNSDGNTAIITFDPQAMCSAEGDYSLFVTYKSDTQKDAAPLDTGTKVTLAKQSVITGNPDLAITTAAPAKTTLKLTGKCMDQMKSVSLAKSDTDPNPQSQPADSGASDGSATFTFPSNLGTATAFQVWYKIDAQSTPVKPKPTITVTAHQ